MVTVLRAHGFNVVIFVDDHVPAHVHVLGAGSAKINLVGKDDEPELVWAFRMKRSDLRRVMLSIADNRQMLLDQWRKIHA